MGPPCPTIHECSTAPSREAVLGKPAHAFGVLFMTLNVALQIHCLLTGVTQSPWLKRLIMDFDTFYMFLCLYKIL